MLTKSSDERAQFSKFQESSMKPWGLLNEARALLQSYSYDLCVRRAQESHELFAKDVLVFFGQDPLKVHDLSGPLHSIAYPLTQHGVTEERIARLALGSKTLASWRELALYGDETMRVARVFEEAEAMLAVKYAEEMQHAFCAIQDKVLAELSKPVS